MSDQPAMDERQAWRTFLVTADGFIEQPACFRGAHGRIGSPYNMLINSGHAWRFWQQDYFPSHMKTQTQQKSVTSEHAEIDILPGWCVHAFCFVE